MDLSFPLELDERTEIATLRLDITRAQKPIARRADAKEGGGNDQKRLRMTFLVEARTGVDKPTTW